MLCATKVENRQRLIDKWRGIASARIKSIDTISNGQTTILGDEIEEIAPRGDGLLPHFGVTRRRQILH